MPISYLESLIVDLHAPMNTPQRYQLKPCFSLPFFEPIMDGIIVVTRINKMKCTFVITTIVIAIVAQMRLTLDYSYFKNAGHFVFLYRVKLQENTLNFL